MGNLNEHFKHSGYTFHRNSVRKERLPRCCQKNLHKLRIGIKYLNPNGEDVILTVCQCSVCGRKFALLDNKYITVDNILKFDTVNLDR